MSQYANERIVHKKDNPELFEHLEGMMFSGDTDVEVEGIVYSAARNTDTAEGEYFVLTPVERRMDL